jgi:hypothetical protein
MRSSQINEIDEIFGKAAVLKMDVHPAESLVTCG